MKVPCKKSFRMVFWSCFAFTFAVGFVYCYFSTAIFPVWKVASGPSELGNTNCSYDLEHPLNNSEQDWDRVFYNRVQKTGSRTLNTLISKLTSIHSYAHFHSKVFGQMFIDLEEQRRIVQLVKNTSAPCSFDRHVFFINFTKYGERPPVYINIIREPVERFISLYFFRRRKKHHHTIKIMHSINLYQKVTHTKMFEDCVLSHDPECTFLEGWEYHDLQLPYFCGQEPRCLYLNDRWAINRAKQNIDKYYVVVGTLEQLNMTLQVLERVLPQFFGGVYEMYRRLGTHENKNPHKEQVKEEIKSLLRANLTSEYELYHFVQQRLYRQYKSLVQDRHKEEQNKTNTSVQIVNKKTHNGLAKYHNWY